MNPPVVTWGRYADMRDERDQWRRRADLLLDQLNAMRQSGFVLPKPGKVTPAPDGPEERMRAQEAVVRNSLRRASFFRKTIDSLKTTNPRLTPAQLEAEAERLWESTTTQEAP